MHSYSSIEKLLHHIFLGNNFIKKILFEIELILLKNKKFSSQYMNHVFISGMPRSGTTVLLKSIYSTKEFASLTYRDMPFVMAPNFYRFLSMRNKNTIPTERFHRDGINFDLDSPEAFDEVFFRTYKNNYEFSNFKMFVNNVCYKYKKNKYLSKNNFNYKRINLIIKLFPNLKILLPFREPLNHAKSLLNQHKNFTNLHKNQKFIKNYMLYLGHMEFGLNHQPWHKPDKFDNKFDINYWLEQWIFFYKDLKKYKKNKNCMFVCYEKLPKKIYLEKVYKFLNLDVYKNKFDFICKNKDYKLTGVDKNLYDTSKSIYKSLISE